MVVDTSALIAILAEEPLGAKAEAILRESGTPALMSAVNLTETLLVSNSRYGLDESFVRRTISAAPIEIVDITEPRAIEAARARRRFSSLNLGDCFCYALAIESGKPILTLDADFAATDARLVPLA